MNQNTSITVRHNVVTSMCSGGIWVEGRERGWQTKRNFGHKWDLWYISGPTKVTLFDKISNKKNKLKKETGLSIKIIWISIDNYFIDSFGFTKPFWAIKRVIQAVYTDKHLCTHEYVPVSCCPRRPSQKPPTLVFCTEYHSFKHIMPFNKTFKKLF